MSFYFNPWDFNFYSAFFYNNDFLKWQVLTTTSDLITIYVTLGSTTYRSNKTMITAQVRSFSEIQLSIFQVISLMSWTCHRLDVI